MRTAVAGGSGGPVVPGPPASSRYGYLVGRLRNRQITMEEATELFALQQTLLRTRAAPSLAPPPPPPPPPTPGPSPVLRTGPPDDLWLFGLLGLGVTAGLLAALLRRASEAPPHRGAPPGGPRSSTRSP